MSLQMGPATFSSPRISSHERGFTLIELLITIAVIGVLVAGIVTVLNPRRQLQRAWDAERKNTLFQLRSVLETYYNDHNEYPRTFGIGCHAEEWCSSEPFDTYGNNGGDWIPGLVPTYIQSLPRDPEGGQGDAALNVLCPGNKQAYLYKSDGQNYALLAYCSMIPNSWNNKYALFDPCRSTWGWKVCVGRGPQTCAGSNGCWY